MSDFLLTQVINFGTPIIALIVFLGAIGIPLPSTLTVIAAGAFVRQGILSWQVAALIGFISAGIGDSLSYGMGVYARKPVLNRFKGTSGWIQAESTFQRWGGTSVFLSRFLITAIAIPVNLIAGTGEYPYRRFIAFDLAGEAVWIIGYGWLGYFFGTEWELVSEFISNFSGFLLGILLLVGAIWLVFRWPKTNDLKIAK